ncbi:MAG: PilT/PilU family type 4a pilus ATPase [Verrucomicrobiota bacterium]
MNKKLNTAPYNAWILDTCLQASWISEDHKQLIEQALQTLGQDTAALDLMQEQEILSKEKADQLRLHIQDYVQSQQQVEPAKPARAQVVAQPEIKVSSKFNNTGRLSYVKEQPPQTQLSFVALLQEALDNQASDLHISPYNVPTVRRFGVLRPLNSQYQKLSPEDSLGLALQFLTPEQASKIEETGSMDFCYEVKGVARLRASVVRQRRGWESVFRIIPERVMTMQELELPPICYEMIRYHNGLILVTGPVSSGKTTTLAAMIHEINNERKDHIITLEEPIEYEFKPNNCQITQREIHTHTESFAAALKGALRQDPDVIMVGEMRDLETISLAITASETGHLVLATLHTSTAARTMQRLLDVFPTNQQAQIRTMVSESIRGVICQQLIPKSDGEGRALALEIMTNTPAIANLIREGNNHMIPGNMQTGKKHGMCLMDDSLIDLAMNGTISTEDAVNRAENQNMVAAAMTAIGAQ